MAAAISGASAPSSSALYGYLPFSGTTLKEHAESVLGPPRPPPSNTPVPEEIHKALLRGLSVDPSARFESMTQLLETLTLEQSDHAAARRGARQRFMSSLLGVALVVSAVQQLRQLHRPLIPRDMLGSGVVLLLAICAGGFLLRRQLISHPFHRTMWLMCLFIMLGNVGQRLLAVTLGMPIEWLFPFEMIFMTIMMAITAGFLFRSLRWAPLLPALAGILSLLNLVPIRTFTLIYPVIVGLAAIGWSRSARTATSTARSGDSSTDSVHLLAFWGGGARRKSLSRGSKRRAKPVLSPSRGRRFALAVLAGTATAVRCSRGDQSGRPRRCPRDTAASQSADHRRHRRRAGAS